ncbi:MAG: hypothetical protein A2X34_07775 [Elusimicrobia bacterium GWC2_51_8]|nr:MAG: hypothetical protein A2X33_03170 [Elusimicrobia bacterium GWA2_51_34]OGR59158.1 MAG: hypothetical protein A2X34_07775 [Elusimicrobia bacterium GWC2_51_8]HAF94860.1 hypothetical protein [Elusimicrobiota bacterium]HCE97181.1 hypothetical protein [Elusimicrobiota bacterium]
MTVMRLSKYLFLFFTAAFFCACVLPVRKNPPPAAPEKQETAVKLSPENVKEAESLYYKAVGAYSNNNMSAALKYLNEISAIHPSYPPAAELREKIRSVSGSR